MSRETLSKAKRKIYERTSKLPVIFKFPVAVVWLLIVYIIAMAWDFMLVLRYAIKETFRRKRGAGMSCIYGIEQSCSECRMCQSKEEQPSTETNNKAILVIDMPKSCEECPMLTKADECILQDEDANWDADTWDDLMAGCPLKKLPQKKPDKAIEEWLTFNNGYNACIEEIAKEGGVNE